MLPQLNDYWFASQIFWLLVIFSVLYLLLAFVYLPKMRYIVQARRNKIDGDIEKAETLKMAAQKAREEYEAIKRESKQKFDKIYNQAIEEMSAQTEREMNQLNKAINEKISAATRGIDEAIESSLDKSTPEIADLTIRIVEVLSGKNLKRSDVFDEVEKIIRENQLKRLN